MHLLFVAKTRKRFILVFEVLNFLHVAIDGNLCMSSFVFEKAPVPHWTNFLWRI